MAYRRPHHRKRVGEAHRGPAASKLLTYSIIANDTRLRRRSWTSAYQTRPMVGKRYRLTHS